jgi:hypothetical protein
MRALLVKTELTNVSASGLAHENAKDARLLAALHDMGTIWLLVTTARLRNGRCTVHSGWGWGWGTVVR